MRIDEVLQKRTIDFLLRMISIPSLSGEEESMVELCRQVFQEVSDKTVTIPIPQCIKKDPYYCSVKKNLDYRNRHNLGIILSGNKKGKPLLFNAHLDVVPPSEGDRHSFSPRKEGRIVYGRGACDDKGSIATLFLLCSLLKIRCVVPKQDIIIHLVCEEEIGGNGTLAILKDKFDAVGVINMEPTNLHISIGHRGAVWFRISFFGKAAHSGSPASGRSALKMAVKSMELLEGYHTDILQASKDIEPFNVFENPMPLTFGMLNAGEWPASVPTHAVIEGVCGFLQNKCTSEIQEGINTVLKAFFGKAFDDHIKVEFPFRNEPYVIDKDHYMVRTFKNALLKSGKTAEVTALTACSDLWRYYYAQGISGIQFGPGRLEFAHAKNERISIDDIFMASEILYNFVT
ncbi:MAG: M20/M25/M40 family metallo-hydrolase [Spirochaetota bacterium]